MNPPTSTSDALRHVLLQHYRACEGMLQTVTQENERLQSEAEISPKEVQESRRRFLTNLNEFLKVIAPHRAAWQQMTPAQRSAESGISDLIQSLLNLTMKVIMLDRDNEQLLARRGFLPVRHLSPPQAQQPHFVSGLYLRHATG